MKHLATKKRTLVTKLLPCLLLMHAGQGLAACTPGPGLEEAFPKFEFGRLAMSEAYPEGFVVASFRIRVKHDCSTEPDPTGIEHRFSPRGLAGGLDPGVASGSYWPFTQYKGLGIRYIDESSEQPVFNVSTNNFLVGAFPASGIVDTTYRVEIVRTSLPGLPTGAVNLIPTSPSSTGVRAGSTNALSRIVGLGISFTVSTQTCTLSDVPVILDPVAAEELPTVGSNAKTKPFNVRLSCTGAPGSEAIWLTLTDRANPANTTDQLALPSGTQERGVRLQILRNGTPIAFKSKWKHGDLGPGNYDIPFSARYLRTGAVVPGDVAGQAILTVAYQ